MAEVPDVDEITPRKKPGLGTYLIVALIAGIVIGGVMLLTGGNGADLDGGKTNPVSPTVTIPQLQSMVDSLNAKVDGFSGRLANMEGQVANLAAPDVTQEDIDSLQASVDTLSADLAVLSNTSSTFNVSGGLTHWLTKSSSDDIWLHVLSAADITLIAEVTVSYDDTILFSDTTYDLALAAFYDEVGTDRDYTPALIPNHTITTTTEICDSYSLTILQEGVNTTFEIPFCYNTTVTLSDWEYAAITFHTGSFSVDANEEFSGRIDYLPEDYDIISVKLLPSLEPSGSSGDGGI